MKSRRIVWSAATAVCVATATLSTAVAAQETSGLTFDVRVTSGESETSAAAQTGRGWIAGKRSRIDLRGPSIPHALPGMSGSDVTFIVHDSAGASTVAVLDHEKKEFAYPAKMVDAIRRMMDALPDKPRFSFKVTNVKVDSLGAGETISGFVTKRFRLSADLTMSVEMLGESVSEAMQVVSEGDYAEELSEYIDPLQSSRLMDMLALGMPGIDSLGNAELQKLVVARPRGLPLRQTDRVTGVTESGSAPPVIVTAISNIKREAISLAIFAIPPGYTQAELAFPPAN